MDLNIDKQNHNKQCVTYPDFKTESITYYQVVCNTHPQYFLVNKNTTKMIDIHVPASVILHPHPIAKWLMSETTDTLENTLTA